MSRPVDIDNIVKLLEEYGFTAQNTDPMIIHQLLTIVNETTNDILHRVDLVRETIGEGKSITDYSLDHVLMNPRYEQQQRQKQIAQTFRMRKLEQQLNRPKSRQRLLRRIKQGQTQLQQRTQILPNNNRSSTTTSTTSTITTTTVERPKFVKPSSTATTAITAPIINSTATTSTSTNTIDNNNNNTTPQSGSTLTPMLIPTTAGLSPNIHTTTPTTNTNAPLRKLTFKSKGAGGSGSSISGGGGTITSSTTTTTTTATNNIPTTNTNLSSGVPAQPPSNLQSTQTATTNVNTTNNNNNNNNNNSSNNINMSGPLQITNHPPAPLNQQFTDPLVQQRDNFIRLATQCNQLPIPSPLQQLTPTISLPLPLPENIVYGAVEDFEFQYQA